MSLYEAIMNLEHQKLDLINWILNLKDNHALQEIQKIRKLKIKPKSKKRKFGCGKNIIISVADDFNAPLKDFIDYMK